MAWPKQDENVNPYATASLYAQNALGELKRIHVLQNPMTQFLERKTTSSEKTCLTGQVNLSRFANLQKPYILGGHACI